MALVPSSSGAGSTHVKAASAAAADRFAPPAWTHKLWFLGTATEVLVFAAIVTFVFGQIAYHTAYFTVDFKADTTAWWGKRTEMVRPTYFILFCIAPLGATLLLGEFLKLYNIHRMSSRYLLKLAMVFRRKPRLRAWISPYTYGELLFLAVVVTGTCLTFSLTYTRHLNNAKAAAAKAKKVVDYAGKLKALAVSLGFTSLFNVSLLLLPAARNGAWLEFLNISYASGIKYRRWLGVAAVLLAQCHCIVFYVLWGHKREWREQALPCFDCPLGAAKGRRWILPSLLLYVISRALSGANSFASVQIKEFTALGHGIVKVVVARSQQLGGHYKVGQFVYLNVPSSPRASPHTLTILLKSLGDWTTDLVAHTEPCKVKSVLPTVFMDGYYGASLEMYDEYPTVCLIGGGIGLTPLLAILEDMVVKLSAGAPLAQHVYLAFAFRELSLLEEIHPLLACIRELDPNEKFLTFHLSLTTAPRRRRVGQAGRPQAPRCAMYTIVFVFVFVVAIVAVLEYGSGKVKRNGRGYLWPHQAFMQLLMLFLGALLVFGLVLVEKLVQTRAKADSAGFFDVFKTPATAARCHYENNIVMFQDLLTAHAVKVGARPDLDLLVRLVRQSHQTFVANNQALATSALNGMIGVFVSGPESLKAAVHFTVASTAPSEFDIHEEEFEL
ncbi:hypothetical protein PybrP1_010752 [[Pythium] brassicae (nom. inval.)]|nr:hypothetical protein PybrP1_010752 [[Pythium] brassicae (nom. inval.)]